MNKKFSTLLLGSLLVGAFTANAETVTTQDQFKKLIVEGVLTLPTGDDELVLSGDVDFAIPYQKFNQSMNGGGEYLVVNTPNVTIKGEDGATLIGRLVLAADNITVSDLNIINNGLGSAGTPNTDNTATFWNKSAISVLADAVTITGNTIQAGDNDKQLLYGIELIPQAKDGKVKYTIEKNKFIGFNNSIESTDGKIIDPSYAVSLDLNYTIDNYRAAFVPGLDGYTSPKSTDFDASALMSSNTFEDCGFNYASIVNPDGDWVKPEEAPLSYAVAQVEPLYDEKTGDLLNADIVKKVVKQAAESEASVVFKGTAEQLQEALGEGFETEANVAVVCNDGNVLYGTAKNPDNGQSAVVADVTAPAPAIDGYKLLEANNGDFNLLVMVAESKSYVIGWDHEADKVIVKGLNEGDLATYASNAEYLWKMTEGQDNTGEKLNYYIFTNQNGDVLEASSTAGTGTNDGKFYPANDFAKYNSGIVFNLYGTTLEKKTAHYFGLYEAGKNVLTVENLNYFEQDGFSVTIKYQDADGKFTKEDIAGNEFVGHLTPMKWDSSKKEFVEFTDATDNATSFYLKNADGEYIVVNAKDAGTSGNNVLYFSTLSEEALEHHLARVAAGDDQEYFGEFKALASASQADPKKLTVIDELQINVNGWLTLGRWDKDETPTLAAATSNIELQPIQIALGSDKIVKAKDLLKKGKFYTVEIVASTEEDDKNVGLKLVAGAKDDNDPSDYSADNWVKSYGNVLEGQFALTVKGDNYIFTNRENQEEAWRIPVNALYTTDEDNEYRYGVRTYKIDTVAGHKASDGYETLSDVKNNKFHIAYASGVFGGNAWLVENHEGDENHVIGLSTTQEDALIFTAKEYAAARQLKVEDKKTHKYYYAPSDSIYVISELGYFDGDDYKTTLDTLKLVSYSFVNQYTEPLIYNRNGEGRYESEVYKGYAYNEKTDKYDIGVRYENVEEAQKAAQHFALRIDGTKLNLRPVDRSYNGTKVYEEVDALNENWAGAWTEAAYKNLGKDEDKTPDAFLYQGLNGWAKVYSGDAGEEGMLSNTNYLNREENDLFVVEPTEKPMYRTVINPLDTISIFRDDNSQSVLFEHNTFLGMENLSQYPEIAKAMIADTAYVRNNTYRPQYMLVVGADITPAGKWCPIHGDDPTCPDAHKVETSGWVEGRYLVNLVDTAIAWDAANKHKDNNPYINSEKYYRLGFVQAKHINDSLVIASTNDTLYVGSEDYNQAKFAFRYVDQEAGSFVIETANYKKLPYAEKAEIAENNLGYLKWMNGVVVVVDDINNADVYNMNENETDTPTANEDIAVEEGVEVIAGNGTVTIQGAAGKTVVITNILGKAVANTTLTSDNQTINVPAGIVVVTVDGEAVKAIVK